MFKKGQIEIVALFGVIFVVAIVVFYAYQSGTFGVSPVPAGVAEQQKAVKNSINSFVRLSTINVLANISTYGGYPDEAAFSSDIEFNNREVPYWQKGGVITKPPNIQATFMNQLSKHIKDHIQNVVDNLDQENVTVETSSISVTPVISSDKIVVNVYLPIYVQGYLIPQPITVNVPTRFGEILEFSENFISYSHTYRPMEYFTLGSMLLSEMTDGVRNVPFVITLIECGDSVQKNWYDLEPYVDYAVRVTLAHTYLPGKAPEGTMQTQSYPKYNIPPLGFAQKTYPDLDVKFNLPDNFELNRATFNFAPDPIMATARAIPMSSICTSDPLYVRYFLRYPMIVSVHDPVTGNVFQFANDVYIYNNKPGEWNTQLDYSDYDEELCTDRYCDADITVVDTDGNPVSGAWVSFMGCDVGVTTSEGKITGNFRIPCAAGTLEVFKSGYKSVKVQASHADMDLGDGFQVTMREQHDIRINLYEVRITEDVKKEHYTIENNPDSVTELNKFETGRKVVLTLTPFSRENCEGDWDTCFREFDTSTATLENIAVDDYLVGIEIIDSAGKSRGKITDVIPAGDISSDAELHIYVPSNLAYSMLIQDITDPGAAADLAFYEQVFDDMFKACGSGVDPISSLDSDQMFENKLPCNFEVS